MHRTIVVTQLMHYSHTYEQIRDEVNTSMKMVAKLTVDVSILIYC